MARDVFALALPIATRMYLTWVETVVEAAECFSRWLDLADWRVVDRAKRMRPTTRHAFAFHFVDYDALTC